MVKANEIFRRVEKMYKNFSKKGPFGMFMYKFKHLETLEAKEALIKMKKQMYKHKLDWVKFSTVRHMSFFGEEELTEAAQKRIKMFNLAEGGNINANLRHSDILFGYSIYRKQPDEYKDKLLQIFYKRYNFPQRADFSSQYLKPFKVTKIKKSAFILWLNNYLRNSASDEILELSSLDIVVKLGQIWNNLSAEEKMAWEKLSSKYLYKRRVEPETDNI